jgi:glycosyltransferase involved in cell wall biosynthesis
VARCVPDAFVNVLLIANRRPDPRGKGDAKIAWQVNETLASEGHSVSLAVPSPVNCVSKSLNALAALACGQPLQIGVTRSEDLHRQVGRILRHQDIDLIVAVHARTAPYVPAGWRPRSVAFLYDSCALAYTTYGGRVPAWMDPVFRLERRLMARFERRIVEEFGRAAALAQPDLRYLRSLSPRSAAVVRVPYSVDLAYFSQTVRRPVADPPQFIFVGRLGYIPNADAVRQLVTTVWPAVRARWPRARLRVVGAGPGSSLRSLLASHRVELAADVDDIRREHEEATALLVPMRMGTGVQTKVLEAMAAGVPVICSTFANAGLNATPGDQLLIADTPQEYVSQAERLVQDANFTEGLVARARTWVSTNHAPAVFKASFLGMCSDLVRQARLPVSPSATPAQSLSVG